MLKIGDDQDKPIEYIFTLDNTLQEVPLVQEDDQVDIIDDDNDDDDNPLDSTISMPEMGRALMLAACSGSVNHFKKLLTQGSAFIADWLGMTPLHFAAENNRVEICELLLKVGLPKDAKNKVDKTPLHLAATEGHKEASELLLRYGSDPDVQDMLKMTPLHWAVQNGHSAVVEILLRHGADSKIKNKFDLTPQSIALQMHSLEMVEIMQVYETSHSTTQLYSSTTVADDNLEETPTFSINQISSKCDETEDSFVDIGSLPANFFNSTDPVIILDKMDINNITNAADKSSSFDNVVFNMCDTSGTEGTTFAAQYSTHTKDPVIINLAKDINDELPQMTQKSDTSVTNLKIVDGVVQQDDDNFSAMQLLQEHGITMLQADNDYQIWNAIIEGGHSVVLTDVGKEVLNTVKQQEEKKNQPKQQKIITVTAEQFAQLTNSSPAVETTNYSELSPTKLSPPKKVPSILSRSRPRKKVIMKKKHIAPFANVLKVQSRNQSKVDVEGLMEELAAAKRTIEEYKSRLAAKEMEVEKYKIQIKLMMNSGL